MDYQQTLDFLYRQLPVFSRVGSVAYKPDIGNILALSEVIGNPHRQLRCVHIGGTNGKGSCSHMIASVLQSAGYTVGLYTSPHLVDFRERIRINGEMITEQEVVEFVNVLSNAIREIQPSFFELTVAMAFDHFARHKVDIAVVEVGLGGLLDSTNIIYPIVSVITNISLDHTQLLGNTLPEIAAQKAGIIKPHVPVVIGEHAAESDPVFLASALHQQSNILFAEDIYRVIDCNPIDGMLQLTIQQHDGRTVAYELDLPGGYQAKNLLTVLTAIDQLRKAGWNINEKAIREGLRSVRSNTGLRGRFEILRRQPYIIADVAHNEAGITEVFKQIGQLPHNKLFIVTGFVQDKDVDHVLKLFPTTAQYFFVQAPIPRALPCGELAAKAQQAGLTGVSYPLISDAMQAVLHLAQAEDLVLVTGSFFIMEDVFRFLEKN